MNRIVRHKAYKCSFHSLTRGSKREPGPTGSPVLGWRQGMDLGCVGIEIKIAKYLRENALLQKMFLCFGVYERRISFGEKHS